MVKSFERVGGANVAKAGNMLEKLVAAIFVGVIAAVFISIVRYEPRVEIDPRFDEETLREQVTSTNLYRDLKAMWRTVVWQGKTVSPVSAINAASRVFATVDLVGKGTNELEVVIGRDRHVDEYWYKAPFFPVETNAMVLRFDCGNFGWQFNLRVGSDGRISEVERRWIR